MSEVAKALGNKLISIREDLGISQEELAFKCGLAAAHMGQLERGEKSPTLDTLQKIADGLYITISDLLDFGMSLPANKLDSKTNKIVAIVQNRSETEKSKAHDMLKLLFK
ncbi:MAG: helix-turn-helix domain-containing protein [Oscillospiraceae bacterium]|nr:helix-turn-helix domain-containing protein [Oscillospiraceae bacterium]